MDPNVGVLGEPVEKEIPPEVLTDALVRQSLQHMQYSTSEPTYVCFFTVSSEVALNLFFSEDSPAY